MARRSGAGSSSPKATGCWWPASPGGKVKATDKPFEDDWVFAITVRDGKLTSIREHVDTQALARAAQTETALAPSSTGF